MSSWSTMFLPSSESKGDLTPDSRISSLYLRAFKVQVTTYNCIRWTSDNAPRSTMLQVQFLALKNQCRPFPFCNTATLSMFFQRSAYNTLRKVYTLAMSSCFIPAFRANGSFTHSVLFLLCRFIQHTRFKAISLLNSKRN